MGCYTYGKEKRKLGLECSITLASNKMNKSWLSSKNNNSTWTFSQTGDDLTRYGKSVTLTIG